MRAFGVRFGHHHCFQVPPPHKQSPGKLAPQYNIWDSWKGETRACHLPTPTTIHKHQVSSSFCKASEIYYNLPLLGCSFTRSRPAACSLPRDPFALFRFLFPYTSCPGIVLFLEALAPSTPPFITPAPPAWGQPSIHKCLGKSPEAWSHFPGKLHGPLPFCPWHVLKSYPPPTFPPSPHKRCSHNQ